MKSAVAALLLLAQVAHAENQDSEVVAAGLSVAGSLVGPALIAVTMKEGNEAGTPLHEQFWPLMAAGGAAIILGPSLGSWYAGQLDTRGLNLRLGGAFAVGVGVALFASGFSLGDDGNDGEVVVGGLVGLAGLGAIAAGTLLDIYDAPRTVARHHLSIAPMITPKQSGLALAGTF